MAGEGGGGRGLRGGGGRHSSVSIIITLLGKCIRFVKSPRELLKVELIHVLIFSLQIHFMYSSLGALSYGQWMIIITMQWLF